MRSIFLYLLALSLSIGQLNAKISASAQQERILDYHVLITLDKKGVLTVEETIKVLALGNAIKRGIFRKLPLYRKDHNGDEQQVNYQLKSVLHNGENAQYTSKIDKYLTIRIGQKEVFLQPGIHTYVITYSTDRQIGFLIRLMNCTGMLLELIGNSLLTTSQQKYSCPTLLNRFRKPAILVEKEVTHKIVRYKP